MRRLLLTVGLVFTGVFLFTGVYLNMTFDTVFAEDPEMKGVLRSVHIYLLLASLLTGLLGLHLQGAPEGFRGILHGAGSICILAAPVVLTAAFILAAIWREPLQQLVGAGLILAAGGCLLHLLAHAQRQMEGADRVK